MRCVVFVMRILLPFTAGTVGTTFARAEESLRNNMPRVFSCGSRSWSRSVLTRDQDDGSGTRDLTFPEMILR
jgi:hypothetical protein